MDIQIVIGVVVLVIAVVVAARIAKTRKARKPNIGKTTKPRKGESKTL